MDDSRTPLPQAILTAPAVSPAPAAPAGPAVLAALVLLLVAPRGAAAGTLEARDLRSEILGEDVKINVLLPDSYAERPDARYPVVYLLHGYGGNYAEWERVGVAGRAGGLDAIIAMPEGDQSFYVNRHGDPSNRWEDYILQEVIPFIETSYRAKAGREHRAVSGLSMGGYGAMMLGLRHPELFASAASHSGALGVPGDAIGGEIGERIQELYGPAGSRNREIYDLFRIAEKLDKGRAPHIYFDCGARDFLLDSNRRFAAHLAKLGIEYEYREVPGAHEFSYWRRNVRYSLERQLEALRDAKPLPAVAGAAGAAGAVAGGAAAAAAVAGSWTLEVVFQDQSRDYGLEIEEKDGALRATLVSPRSGEHPIKAAAFREGVLRLEIERDIGGMPVTFVYEGRLAGGKLSGKVSVAEFPDFAGEWSAERKKAEGGQ